MVLTAAERAIWPVRDEECNRAGRARAMTVFTPVRGWARLPSHAGVEGKGVRVPGWPATEAVFLWVRANRTGLADIKKLSFIHFARWGIIRSIPDLGQGAEHLRRPLFMFESNYNGTFEQYIDAFSKVIGSGIQAFWFTSDGFPGPIPVQPFKEYIRANELVLDHYYCAYPVESATQVVAALELRSANQSLLAKAKDLDPEAFARALDTVLSPASPAAELRGQDPLRQAWNAARELFRAAKGPGRRSRNGRSYYFTSLAPVLPGHEAELKADLGALAAASPFAAVPEVHLARWLVIDDWPDAPGRRIKLRSSYLLCTAAVTAEEDTSSDDLLGSFLAKLLAADGAAAIKVWSHCRNFPGGTNIEAKVDYLTSSQLDTVLFYLGYDATPAEVDDAATHRDRLHSFARANGALDPAALQKAYLEASPW